MFLVGERIILMNNNIIPGLPKEVYCTIAETQIPAVGRTTYIVTVQHRSNWRVHENNLRHITGDDISMSINELFNPKEQE